MNKQEKKETVTKDVEIKEVHMEINPIHPCDFADNLKEAIITFSPRFFVGEKMMDVFQAYGSTFNRATLDNEENKTPRRYVVPLATGSAKTTAMKMYGAMTEGSAILIVRKAMTAVEVVHDINAFAGADIARTYYSVDEKNGRPDTAERVKKHELENHRIIVLTHKMLHGLSQHSEFARKTLHSLVDYTHYNNPLTSKREKRNTIVIDERIDLIRAEEFNTHEFIDMKKMLAFGLKHQDNYLEIMDALNEFLKLFTFDKSNTAIGSNMVLFTEDQLTVVNKNVGVFTTIKKVLDDQNLRFEESSGMRKMKVKDSDNENVKNAILDVIDRVLFVCENKIALTKKGSYTVAFAAKDLSLVFGSVVILDATANVNRVYESYLRHQGKSTVMLTKPEIRTYQNATLHVAKGFKQSKYGLYSKVITEKVGGKIVKKTVPKNSAEKIEVVKGYLSLLYAELEPSDNMLVVVHKFMLEIFREHCTVKNITFISWGNHAGSNEWKHYNKAAVIGWYRIDKHHHANSMFAGAGAGGYHDYSPSFSYDVDIEAIALSSIAEDLIQFFNRIRCRISIDEAGNHDPVDFYLFSDDKPQSKEVIDMLTGELPYVKISNWKVAPTSTIKKKRGKAVERAESIINLLKVEAVTKGDVFAEDIRAKLGTTKQAFSTAIKLDSFKEDLVHYGMKQTVAEKVHGRPMLFDFTDVKNL